jgi:hypothetical protein
MENTDDDLDVELDDADELAKDEEFEDINEDDDLDDDSEM